MKSAVQAVPRTEDVADIRRPDETSTDQVLWDDDEYRKFLVGATAVWNGWKIILAVKNITAVIKNDNLEYEPLESCEFSRSLQVFFESSFDLILKIVKLYGNFYPFIWENTSTGSLFGLSEVTSRAIRFSLLINIIHGFESFLTGIFPILLSSHGVKRIEATRHIKSTFIRQAKENVSFFLRIMCSTRVEQETILTLMLLLKAFHLICSDPADGLKYEDTTIEVPQTMKEKARSVGFPVERIKMADPSLPPRVKYLKVNLTDYIVVNSSLLDVLDNVQAAIIFSHELGHWKRYHIYCQYFFSALEFVLGDVLLYLAYDNETVSRLFRLDPEAHPIAQVLLIAYFVHPLVCEVVRSFANVVNTHLELQADDFAYAEMRRQSNTSILVQTNRFSEALKKLAVVDPYNYHFFDRWFASFFHGQPTLPRRLKRTDKRLTFQETR